MKWRDIRIKPTTRKNGEKMFPLRIEFTVGRSHLVEVALHRIIDGRGPYETRYEWLNKLAEALEERGAFGAPEISTDDYTEEEIAEAKQRAEAAIDRVFPDLKA